MLNRIALGVTLLLLASGPAFAHLDPLEHGSLMAGISHPLFGLDHILAMVAVGLWAAAVGGRAIGLVPAAFVGTMAIGFAAAIAGLPLPFVEPVILASVIVIGILVALALPVPVPAVAGLVAFFALFHGHAHGGELGAAGAIEFAVGFIASTIVLHGIGIALGLGIGRLVQGERGALLTRLLGGATALGGLWLAFAG